MRYKGRFAPSPTGDLHLGSVATALFATVAARSAEGSIVLRVEDLDPPRTIPGSEASQLRDLAWLGFRFDEQPGDSGPSAPYRQSERLELYCAALDVLAREGHTYLCDCSRAEIARAASAPHEGEEGPRYPGTCRSFGMRERPFRRAPAVRLAVPIGRTIRYEDVLRGICESRPSDDVGDFVLRRGDGVFAYQLAVVVDDLAMGVTDVVRGADLLSSAGRQALLFEMLGATAPRFLHVPLLVEAGGGERLAKRRSSYTIGMLRERSVSPVAILSTLARAYGQTAPVAGDGASFVDALARTFDPQLFPTSPVALASEDLAA
ncbi:MAG: tRNA glutamyl-Q(34) synthetase GluQRS [Polyangiaceae bacterium]|nr:tRNA glutamyl-Q(34) synthetase GluQRS [Polyangiaceae bacterium]